MSATSGGPRVLSSRGGAPLLVMAVVALVVLLAAVGGYLVLRGGGGGGDGATGPGSGASAPVPTTTTPTPEPTPTAPPAPDPFDDPMSLESIDLRYDRLASNVTARVTRCRSAKERAGQSERLVCHLRVATLELVTYRRARDLEQQREDVVTYLPGGVLETTPTRTLMAFHSLEPGRQGDPTYLYVDDEQSRQSATYSTDGGRRLAPLVRAREATHPVLSYPSDLTERPVVRFAARWVGRGECLRIETLNAGELEESYCEVPGPVEVFVGRFRTPELLQEYRRLVVASAVADKRSVRDWSRKAGGDPVGALYEYTTKDGTVARYWDDASCSCYAEAFLADGTYERLARWWEKKP